MLLGLGLYFKATGDENAAEYTQRVILRGIAAGALIAILITWL